MKIAHVFAVLTLVISICIAAFYYVGFMDRYYQELIGPADISDFPQTAGFMNGFYESWKNKEWKAMAQYPFGNMTARAYEELLSDKILTDYRITDISAKDNYWVDFEVILTVNEEDCLVSPVMFWNPKFERWTLSYHDFEFVPFDFEVYRAYVEQNSQSKRFFDTALVLTVSLLIGFIITLIVAVAERAFQNRRATLVS